MKRLLLIVLCIFVIFAAVSCGDDVPGPQGERGPQGAQGVQGEAGANGKSAYDLAVENGFEGSVEEWILSLVGEKGADGADVVNIEKTSTQGLVDTYTMTFSDGKTSQFTLTNANGISKIEKTDTVGLVDTYTITMSSGLKSYFNVSNGAPGKTTEFRVDGGWLQWKYTDEDDSAWRNLFETDGTPAPEGLASVKFVTNGGSIGSSPETILVTIGTTISLPTPTYAGYSFDGWFANTNDDYAVSSSYRVHESVTLYARWTPGASVTGTKIYSLNDLARINYNRGGTYVLMNDIDCMGLGLPSLCNTADTAFTGLIDGQGFKIYNFQVTASQYMGLIGYNAGTIRNLNLSFGSLTLTAPPASGDIFASILAGYNTGNIERCSVTDSEVSVTTHERVKHSGLICGYNTGSIKNCLATGTVQTKEDWQSTKVGTGGAIAGGNAGSIQNCLADAYVYGLCKCGVGVSFGEFTALIAGRNYKNGKISACLGMGTVECNKFLGDVTARNEGTVEKCYISSSTSFSTTTDLMLLATKVSNAQLNIKSFYTGTLAWSDSIWSLDTLSIENKKYPTLKQ